MAAQLWLLIMAVCLAAEASNSFIRPGKEPRKKEVKIIFNRGLFLAFYIGNVSRPKLRPSAMQFRKTHTGEALQSLHNVKLKEISITGSAENVPACI